MPVADHAIHPSTQIGPEHRYGCMNRDVNPYYYAPNGYSPYVHHGEQSHVFVKLARIEHAMSTDCKHESATDPHCEGCEWRRNEVTS